MAVTGDRIVMNFAELAKLLASPEGPVAQDLTRRAVNVTNQAKLNATGIGVAGAINPEGRGPRVQTGRLRSSISFDVERDAQGLVAHVGTNVPYGLYLELGLLASGRKYPFLVPALPASAF